MSTWYIDLYNGNDSNSGADWANAWKTITNGATNARIAAGDTIRISKTPDPVSIGNATWTSDSNTVTLATAQTANIDLCESGWSADNGSTATTSTTRKEGSNSLSLTTGTPSTSQLLCHKTLTTIDLSSYQKISFWFRNNTSAVSDGASLKVCLCSDTAGATIVDTFWIPAVPSTSLFRPLTLTKEGGGNLGASIQSVAVYSGTTNPGNSKVFLFDDIVACTTSGLNLQSLISKASTAQGANEGFWGIQSISGTTIKLDGDPAVQPSSTWYKYYGTTETVATYIRQPYQTALVSSASTNINTANKGGSAGSYISYEGGYNTSNSAQDGETFFDGSDGYGYGFYSNNDYVSINWLSFCRYYGGVNISSGYYDKINNISNSCNNASHGIYSSSRGITISKIYNLNCNNSNGLLYSGPSMYASDIVNVLYNNAYGLNIQSYKGDFVAANIVGCTSGGIYLYWAIKNRVSVSYMANTTPNVFSSGSANNTVKISNGNGTTGVTVSSSDIVLVNSVLNQSTEFSFSIPDESVITSLNHDATDGNHIVQMRDCQTIYQATTYHGTDPGSWKMIPGTTRTSSWPARLKIAEMAVAASSQVTAKAWIKKDHATNVAAKLLVLADTYFNLSNDVSTTKASDTDWEEVTLTFTPTKKGVIPLYVEGWYVSGASNIYIGSISITQA